MISVVARKVQKFDNFVEIHQANCHFTEKSVATIGTSLGHSPAQMAFIRICTVHDRM